MVKHESDKKWLTCFIWYKWRNKKLLGDGLQTKF